MATKNYMINDKWLDLDKQNIVELQSVDGVLDSLKVNGSEIVTPSGKITITENGTDIDVAQYALADVNVEGGGGSSDFSTAEVTIIASTNFGFDSGLTIFDNTFGIYAIGGATEGTEIIDVPLYKGHCTWFQDPTAVVLSGNAQVVTDEEGNYIDITGDCTITIS